MSKSPNPINYINNWESEIDRRSELHVAYDDKDIVKLFQSGEVLISLRGGNLYKSLGGNNNVTSLDDTKSIALKLDLGQIELGESKYLFASHCRIANFLQPWRSTFIVNSPVIRNRRISPKGHPGDGKFEMIEFSMSLQQSMIAYRRSKSGDHVPHPDIKISRKSNCKIKFKKKQRVSVDGKTVKFSRDFSMSVIPHAICVVLN
ncbi:MAG: hypothetical protein CL431_09195 [Acidimicrobiaceae bacterium]|jgi:hypothetical protein|nr:hypothetical protein [Acidimicrobiaceae bacterium]|tara:strand:+ start:57941 stop:58552 length:612 start_codon:yes stop_codon:yes gene_type:complete